VTDRPLVEVSNLEKHFPLTRTATEYFRGQARRAIHAVDGVTVTVAPGETVGLIGESGSGKTTLGWLVARLHDPTGGSLKFEGRDIAKLEGDELRYWRRNVQVVFQDPVGSLDPRLKVWQIVGEPVRAQYVMERRFATQARARFRGRLDQKEERARRLQWNRYLRDRARYERWYRLRANARAIRAARRGKPPQSGAAPPAGGSGTVIPEAPAPSPPVPARLTKQEVEAMVPLPPLLTRREVRRQVPLPRKPSRKQARARFPAPPRLTKLKLRNRVQAMLPTVGLPVDCLDQYPHEFSGGGRQRLSLARAFIVDPKLVVLDEPTSALDVAVQAQILNRLVELQRERRVAYLLITHNVAAVRYVADRVAVMYLGQIVEVGTVHGVLEHPVHPYTKALLAALPVADARRRRMRFRIGGDVPSLVSPPPGCRFAPRCPFVVDRCRAEDPRLRVVPGASGQQVACHRAEDVQDIAPESLLTSVDEPHAAPPGTAS